MFGLAQNKPQNFLIPSCPLLLSDFGIAYVLILSSPFFEVGTRVIWIWGTIFPVSSTDISASANQVGDKREK